MRFRHAPVLHALLFGLAVITASGSARADDETAKARGTQDLTQGALRFSRLQHDFGKARQQQDLETVIEVRNMSERAVTGLRVVADCGCYAATVSNTELAPRAQARILIRFKTMAMWGSVTKYPRVRWQDDQERSVKMQVHVDITKGIVLDPGRMHFPQTLVGRIPQGEMLIKYHREDGQPFRLTHVEVPELDLVVSEPRAWEKGDWKGWRIRFRFRKPPPEGVTTSAAFLKTDHPDYPRIRVSVGVMVHGKVWLQKKKLYLGLVPKGSERKATLLFRGFDRSIDLGEVKATSRRGRVSVSVREATHLPRPQGGPTLYELVLTLPANAPEGPIRDTVEILTQVPGYERVAIPVSGRIYIRR